MPRLLAASSKTQCGFHDRPFGCFLDDYATQLKDRGYVSTTIYQYVWIATDWCRWLRRSKSRASNLNSRGIKNYLLHRHRTHCPTRLDHPALEGFLSFLHEKGIAHKDVMPVVMTPLRKEVQAFQHYLNQERRLRLSTQGGYLVFIRRFLTEQFGRGPVRYDRLCVTTVTDFVRRHAPKLSQGGKPVLLTALRVFLRYLRYRDLIVTDLAACVPRVANWRLSSLPKFIPSKDVQKLLRSCDYSTPRGSRNYAILLILARLGLRVGEVLSLQLEDICWGTGELLIRSKGGRMDRMPLPHDVGQAIAAYLKKGRPRCSSRHLFIRALAPHRPLSARSAALSKMVHRALDRAGIQAPTPRRGAHLLRHSLATSMLQNGASLPEIAQILRHRRLDTTALYAKVDDRALSTVARPWPGGAR